jgi:hypothetical protein
VTVPEGLRLVVAVKRQEKVRYMLTAFGFVAVSIMMLSYLFEAGSKWYVLIFAGASVATADYSGLADVYPITVVEIIWSAVALRRFIIRHRAEQLSYQLQ